MSFLALDGARITDYENELYEVSTLQGIVRLLQPWKYYLHGTLGRPIIVTHKWGKS